MNKVDKDMLYKLMQNKDKYRIMVDNDSIWVEGSHDDDVIHSFTNYGWEFIVELLQYLGLDAEEV